jgi:hypothetical protein
MPDPFPIPLACSYPSGADTYIPRMVNDECRTGARVRRARQVSQVRLTAARHAAEPRVTEVLRKHVHGLQILGHWRCREQSGPANLWTKVEF